MEDPHKVHFYLFLMLFYVAKVGSEARIIGQYTLIIYLLYTCSIMESRTHSTTARVI